MRNGEPRRYQSWKVIAERQAAYRKWSKTQNIDFRDAHSFQEIVSLAIEQAFIAGWEAGAAAPTAVTDAECERILEFLTHHAAMCMGEGLRLYREEPEKADRSHYLIMSGKAVHEATAALRQGETRLGQLG